MVYRSGAPLRRKNRPSLRSAAPERRVGAIIAPRSGASLRSGDILASRVGVALISLRSENRPPLRSMGFGAKSPFAPERGFADIVRLLLELAVR